MRTMRLFKNPNFLVGFVIVLVVAAGGVGYTLWQNSQAAPANGTDAPLYARVHDGDGKMADIPLDTDGTRTVTSSIGTNVLVVKGGSVHVESATCENKDCIHQGEISQPGQQIICLPNKMWIEVVHEGDADGQMDANATPDAGDAAASGLDATAR